MFLTIDTKSHKSRRLDHKEEEEDKSKEDDESTPVLTIRRRSYDILPSTVKLRAIKQLTEIQCITPKRRKGSFPPTSFRESDDPVTATAVETASTKKTRRESSLLEQNERLLGIMTDSLKHEETMDEFRRLRQVMHSSMMEGIAEVDEEVDSEEEEEEKVEEGDENDETAIEKKKTDADGVSNEKSKPKFRPKKGSRKVNFYLRISQ